MVKIEQLKDGAKATYTRDYTREQAAVGLHNLISFNELQSMIVTKGTVIYTIDEKIFGEKSAPVQPAPVQPAPVKVAPKATPKVAKAAPVEVPAETPAPAPEPAAPTAE